MGNAQPKYDLNDLQSDLDHLGHLIDTIADHLMEGVKFVAPGDDNGARLPGMDRLNALVWLARDNCAMLNELIDKHFDSIGATAAPIADPEKIDVPNQVGGTVVRTSLATYCPTIDLSQISVWEARLPAEVLRAASVLINAAIPEKGPVMHYLDNWQALLNAAGAEIAEVTSRTRPMDPREQKARSWLLAQHRLDCAEDLMLAEGTSAAGFEDEFSRELMASRATS